MIRRTALVFLCLLLAGNGPLELVRCETGGDARLSLSFFGICFCHETTGDCHAQCAGETEDNGLQASGCGCCLDTVVAELDPTLVSKTNVENPVTDAVSSVPLPKLADERGSLRIVQAAIPRSAAPLITVLRI